MPDSKKSIKTWLVIAIAAIAVGAGALYVATHAGDISRQLTLATSRQPEPFTELYFAEPQDIPQKAVVGQKLNISFVIKNHEAKDMAYTYRLYFTDAQNTTFFGDYQVDVPADRSQTITQEVTVPAGQGRGSLGVQLINKGQSVHFWLEREQKP